VADDEQAGRRTLAHKLDHLFHTVHPADRGEFSFEEVAEAIRARGGPTISATYLWQLRRGLRDNPTKKHLEALAGFFGVPPAYFFDDAAAERIKEELVMLAALRDASVRQIALRATGLSPESLGAITDMIERVRELEGLPGPMSDRPTRRRRGRRS
jgi:transcriptional regulator with XRE-family HTH domain